MGQVLHRHATTTEAVRRAIQHSQESLMALSAPSRDQPQDRGQAQNDDRAAGFVGLFCHHQPVALRRRHGNGFLPGGTHPRATRALGRAAYRKIYGCGLASSLPWRREA